MNYIYGLIDPRDNLVRYVGKTKTPERRLKEHLGSSSLKYNTYKNSWLKKLISLELVPIFKIIEECDDDNWQEREIYWIAYYRKLLGDKLTNTTDGGDGLNNPSLEVRQKISEANKGMPCSDELREIRRKNSSGENNPFYGKTHTPEVRELYRKLFTGKKHTEETKRKLSLLSLGKIITDIDKYRRRLKRKKNNLDRFIGVYANKQQKFFAKLKVNDVYYYSRAYETQYDAALEYDKLAEKHLGKYAVYNLRPNIDY